MKILVVASYNSGKFSPFVIEQATSIKQFGIETDYFGVQGKGIGGYLRNRRKLLKKIKAFKPDIVHAHYGLSGLLANLQRKIPVVTTYHGSDIHSGGYLLFLSKVCMSLSTYNIFVSNGIFRIAGYEKANCDIISCGVDVAVFYPVPKEEARKLLGWSNEEKYILFSGSFDNAIKNSKLARESCDRTGCCHMIEMKGYSRKEVNLLMNACDSLLLTSFREASPQVVKEAIACGCPIVSVDVGDVQEMINGITGCYIAERNAEDISQKLLKTLDFKDRTNVREKIAEYELDLKSVAKKVIAIYERILA